MAWTDKEHRDAIREYQEWKAKHYAQRVTDVLAAIAELPFEKQFPVLKLLCGVNPNFVVHPEVEKWSTANAAHVAAATK